jgi:hypothetical protein
MEALSPTCVLVLFARGGHQLLTRVATQADVRNAEIGYEYSKCALRWEASACVLDAAGRANSGTRSYLTAKLFAAKGLLAVLSTARSQGRCDVFAVGFNAAAATVSFRLAKSVSQEGLLTDEGGARAFWHTVTQPQLDLLYLVAFSHTQCHVIVIPGNVLLASSDGNGEAAAAVADITVMPLIIPDASASTIVTARGTQSYRKGEVRGLPGLVACVGAEAGAAGVMQCGRVEMRDCCCTTQSLALVLPYAVRACVFLLRFIAAPSLLARAYTHAMRMQRSCASWCRRWTRPRRTSTACSSPS